MDHERKEEKLSTKIDEYVNTYEQSQSGSQASITVAVKTMIAFANKQNDTQREAVAALFHAAGDSIKVWKASEQPAAPSIPLRRSRRIANRT